jgi:hypothetical protein
MKTRIVHISRSQNLATLIDNVYGELVAWEARGLLAAIDDAERNGGHAQAAAIGYLRGLGIEVRVVEVAS